MIRKGILCFFVLILNTFCNYLSASENLQIYFFRGKQIYKINLDGTEEKCISSGNTSRFQWSPDGKKICFMTRKGLFLVDQSNKEKLLTSFPQKSKVTNCFEWSPNSKKIVYGVYDKDTNKDTKIDKKDSYSLYLLTVSSLGTKKIASISGSSFQTPFYWSKKEGNIYFTNFTVYSCDYVKVKYYRYSVKNKRSYLQGSEKWPNNNLVKYIGKKFLHFNQTNDDAFWKDSDTSKLGQVAFIEMGNLYLKNNNEEKRVGEKIRGFDCFVDKFNMGYHNPIWLPDNYHILVVKNTFMGNHIYIVDIKTKEIRKLAKGKAANYFHKR